MEDRFAWGRKFKSLREEKVGLTQDGLLDDFSFLSSKLTDAEISGLRQIKVDNDLLLSFDKQVLDKSALSRYEKGVRIPDRGRILYFIFYFKGKGVLPEEEADAWLESAGRARLYPSERQYLYHRADDEEIVIPAIKKGDTFTIPQKYIRQHTGYAIFSGPEGLIVKLITVFLLAICIVAALLYGQPIVESLKRLFILPSATPQLIILTTQATNTATPTFAATPTFTTQAPTTLPVVAPTEPITLEPSPTMPSTPAPPSTPTPTATLTEPALPAAPVPPSHPATLTVEADEIIATAVAATIAALPLSTPITNTPPVSQTLVSQATLPHLPAPIVIAPNRVIYGAAQEVIDANSCTAENCRVYSDQDEIRFEWEPVEYNSDLGDVRYELHIENINALDNFAYFPQDYKGLLQASLTLRIDEVFQTSLGLHTWKVRAVFVVDATSQEAPGEWSEVYTFSVEPPPIPTLEGTTPEATIGD